MIIEEGGKDEGDNKEEGVGLGGHEKEAANYNKSKHYK